MNHSAQLPTRIAPIVLGLGVLVATVGMGWAGQLTVHAQQAATQPSLTDVGITTIPPRLGENFELKAKPGEKVQAAIRVRNSSDRAIPVKVLVEDFILDSDGATPIPVRDQVSNRWSLASWISVSPDQAMLQPRQSTTVNIVIDVPADALPGGRYAMVLYEPDLLANPASPFAGLNDGSRTGIGQRVGTLVYFLVEGPINEDAYVRNFKFTDFSEFGPVPYSFTVENVSDVHIRPQIGIEIYNIFGKKVDTIQVEAKNVFPFVSREITGEWDRVWGIGLYKARVVMSYGSEGKVAFGETSFWLIPLKLVLAAAFALLSLVGIIIAVRRHLIHRQDLTRKQVELLQQRVAELEQQQPPVVQ
jgi:hypothetical protein